MGIFKYYFPVVVVARKPNDGFLKVNCIVKSETVSVSFSDFVTLKCTGISHTLNGVLPMIL
jgi:hypothetical protein